MSDYEHIKAIRYKPTEEQIDKIFEEINEWRKEAKDYLWIKNRNDWPEYLEDIKFTTVFTRNYQVDCNYFKIDSGYSYKEHQTNYYVDFVLFSSYGEESSDWERARYLSDTEKQKWKIKFQDIFPDIDENGLVLVDYCYYNGCDAPDVYDPEDIKDDFYEEV